MSSTRREFLKRSTWMALATGVPLGFAERISAQGRSQISLGSSLGLAAFKSQLESTFFINHEGRKVEVKLIEVTSFGSRKRAAQGREGFSLIFQGEADTNLQQNTYLIEHEQLGMFSFFVVPVMMKNQSASHYEAVVNRLYP